MYSVWNSFYYNYISKNIKYMYVYIILCIIDFRNSLLLYSHTNSIYITNCNIL